MRFFVSRGEGPMTSNGRERENRDKLSTDHEELPPLTGLRNIRRICQQHLTQDDIWRKPNERLLVIGDITAKN